MCVFKASLGRSVRAVRGCGLGDRASDPRREVVTSLQATKFTLGQWLG